MFSDILVCSYSGDCFTIVPLSSMTTVLVKEPTEGRVT